MWNADSYSPVLWYALPGTSYSNNTGDETKAEKRQLQNKDVKTYGSMYRLFPMCIHVNLIPGDADEVDDRED